MSRHEHVSASWMRADNTDDWIGEKWELMFVTCPDEFRYEIGESSSYDALRDWSMSGFLEPTCLVPDNKTFWLLFPDPGCELDV